MYSQIDSNKRRSLILVFVFILLITGVGFLLGAILGQNNTVYPYGFVIGAVIISLLMTSVSYFAGDKIALSASGAKQISKEQNPYLYNMVENLCLTSGQPIPKIHIIEDPAINAFATGRKPEISSIAVTTGALEKLENEELEGVIAHELSHIKNYDIRLMMLVVVLVGTISILIDWGLRIGFLNRRSDDREGSNPVFLILGLILLILAPIIAQMIKFAISRRREYLADASGALLTRYPEGLAIALEKIANDNLPLKKSSTATAHLFIASPFNGERLATIFSTHPPITERIKRLREMGN